jgi:hypothetical protein
MLNNMISMAMVFKSGIQKQGQPKHHDIDFYTTKRRGPQRYKRYAVTPLRPSGVTFEGLGGPAGI